MRKLGIYISSFADTAASSQYLTKGSFVYYELFIRELRIWCPSKEALIHKKPEEVIFLRSQDDVTNHVMSIYEAWTDYYMLYNNTTYRMRSIEFNVDYMVDCQVIDNLSFESIDGHETWNISGDDALRILYKSKAVSKELERAARSILDFWPKTIINSVSPDFNVVAKMEEPKEERKMDNIDTFYKAYEINIHENTIWTKIKRDKCIKHRIMVCAKNKEVVKDIMARNRDTFVMILYMLQANEPEPIDVIFIPAERKTIIRKTSFRRTKTESEFVVKDRSKSKFDYIHAFMIAYTKHLAEGGYNWYDKLTTHRKIKEV